MTRFDHWLANHLRFYKLFLDFIWILRLSELTQNSLEVPIYGLSPPTPPYPRPLPTVGQAPTPMDSYLDLTRPLSRPLPRHTQMILYGFIWSFMVLIWFHMDLIWFHMQCIWFKFILIWFDMELIWSLISLSW